MTATLFQQHVHSFFVCFFFPFSFFLFFFFFLVLSQLHLLGIQRRTPFTQASTAYMRVPPSKLQSRRWRQQANLQNAQGKRTATESSQCGQSVGKWAQTPLQGLGQAGARCYRRLQVPTTTWPDLHPAWPYSNSGECKQN
jgi:hypothetical protein